MAWKTNSKKKCEDKEDKTLRFENGLLEDHLIKQAGSKFKNKISLEGFVKKEQQEELIEEMKPIIRSFKYEIVKNGVEAIMFNAAKKMYSVGKVIDYNKYGTNDLYYLKVVIGKIIHQKDTFSICEEYKLNETNGSDITKFVIITSAYNVATGDNVDIKKINKIIGRDVYSTKPVVLNTPYIPAEVFLNDWEGKSDTDSLEQIFDLERQMLMEIKRDIDLGRKKILYKTRLARKTKGILEIEMNNDSIVVFEDGNAVFTSPIDLWAPQLIIKSITETIDWLKQYVLKMKFAAKDVLMTGAQKTDSQSSDMNEDSHNYNQDKAESWSITLSKLFRKIYSNKKIKAKIEISESTQNRIQNGSKDGKPKTNTPPQAKQGGE